MAKTIALYGDSGHGKTTQIGELAKDLFKRERKRTRYYSADFGGHASIDPLIDLGIIDVKPINQGDDPWVWANNAARMADADGDFGLVAYDSATSIGELILNAVTKSDQQIGQQKTQKFRTGQKGLTIGLNNEAHYGLVQTFLADTMWESSWLTRKGIDVLWTFGTHRGETVESEPLVGPKVAGKALTAMIPKWFTYTFRIVAIPVPDGPPRHVLYLQPQPGHTGLAVSFGNSRYPLDATTTLPTSIEPASLVEAFRLIDQGKEEATAKIKAELGL